MKPSSSSSSPPPREEQLQLLRELKQNSSISIRAMARETDLTTGCVRRLLKKLEQEETREGSALKRFQELSAEEQKHIVHWWLARNAQEEELSVKSLNGKSLLWRRVRQTNTSNSTNNSSSTTTSSGSGCDVNKRKVEAQEQEEGSTPWPPAKRKVSRQPQQQQQQQEQSEQCYPFPFSLHTTHTLQPPPLAPAAPSLPF